VGDPRNPARAGEQWNPARWKVLREELEALKTLVVLSGGWAWHFMAPPHEELKIHHDHRDVDLFIEPERLVDLIQTLRGRGYERVWTRHDKHANGEFVRYARYVVPLDEYSFRPLNEPVSPAYKPPDGVKVLLDVFIAKVPFIEVQGFRVVEPKHLLSLYETTHSTNDCTSVVAAKKLVAKGINPVGRAELVTR